jgi:magnesium chelatase family protein
MDMHVKTSRITSDEMVTIDEAESSAAIRSRVIAARQCQEERLSSLTETTDVLPTISCNADIPASLIPRSCQFDDAGSQLFRSPSVRRYYSADRLDRIARVARTIADLAGSSYIQREHVVEAFHYSG